MIPTAISDMDIAANILYQYLSEWQGGCAPKCLHIHNRNIYTTYSRPTYNNLYVELYRSVWKSDHVVHSLHHERGAVTINLTTSVVSSNSAVHHCSAIIHSSRHSLKISRFESGAYQIAYLFKFY